jgi:hypothetical protein
MNRENHMTLDPAIRFFNSTFVITLLGGVLAAGVTAAWQARSAHNTFQRVVLEHELQDRRIAAKEFADGFGGALYLFNDLLMRRLWLAAHYKELSHVYPDGRHYISERTVFEALESKVYSHPIPESLADRVAVTFTSPSLQSDVHQLLDTLNKMIVDPDEDSLGTDFNMANRYQDLISQMQSEITAIEHKWEKAQ